MIDGIEFLVEYTNQVLRLLGIKSNITFTDGRQPYCETQLREDHVIITCEMPNVPANDLRIKVAENYVNVTAGKGLSKLVNTPSIIEDAAEINYKNGVLEIKAPIK